MAVAQRLMDTSQGTRVHEHVKYDQVAYSHRPYGYCFSFEVETPSIPEGCTLYWRQSLLHHPENPA